MADETALSGLCAALAGGMMLLVPGEHFQLAWTHSVEKVEWREEWRVLPHALLLEQASVAGSGAGMEPPPEARFEQGRWVWRPMRQVPQAVLALSEFTSDWRLCGDAEGCRPLRELVPGEATVTLRPCP